MSEKRKHETVSPGRADRKSFYSSKRWRATRRQVLFEQSWCQCDWEPCTALATEVDHIKPRAEGGDDFARWNLQALCHRHHSQKTARENRLGHTLRADG